MTETEAQRVMKAVNEIGHQADIIGEFMPQVASILFSVIALLKSTAFVPIEVIQHWLDRIEEVTIQAAIDLKSRDSRL